MGPDRRPRTRQREPSRRRPQRRRRRRSHGGLSTCSRPRTGPQPDGPFDCRLCDRYHLLDCVAAHYGVVLKMPTMGTVGFAHLSLPLWWSGSPKEARVRLVPAAVVDHPARSTAAVVRRGIAVVAVDAIVSSFLLPQPLPLPFPGRSVVDGTWQRWAW
jgi:hypothetical protein